MRWRDITDNNAKPSFPNKFWGRFSEVKIPEGTFWADTIVHVKDDPMKRIELGLSFLPYPAAFSESCKGIRKLISERSRLKQNIDVELESLYQLAVIHSMLVPYSEKLNVAGYNVMEMIPGNLLFNLNFTYSDIGYEKIQLLGKSDITKLVTLYGQPKRHSTLNEMYRDIWDKYEKVLGSMLEKKQELFKDRIRNILSY